MDDRKEGTAVEPHYIYGYTPQAEHFACSVTGASHLRQGMPCQDAFGTWAFSVAEESVTLMTIADGHGSAKHDLSEFGSKLACTVALEVMRDLYKEFHIHPQALQRSFKSDFPRLVQRRWHEAVLADARVRGIEVPEDPVGFRKLFSRYGTTMLACMVTPSQILLGQLGDGDIFLVNKDGSVELPFPRASDEMIGNVTYSMSHEEAGLLWQTSQLPQPKESALLLLCTDGLTNCFETDHSFYQFGRTLLGKLGKEGLSHFGGFLPDILKDFSARGSGDDISVALLLFHCKPSKSQGTKNKEVEPA
ncbi:hypothetical protein PAECIP111891_03185 [Paenibacillus allorhizoplanae]|uniref:PPM-type phosphatase domain-containing protein n=1 Tax=Paenibacillus allorhizoplanae TaxID=2905648 RepID=A0ABN8GG68_9BACL|nr:PP2C family serine/threonine-protein phosphatase [Paenibacillus allorhizoplanae]CAH1208263.1 hypothetical protein PAECIP111891_03185 [Paenibacillus allorhizoplanae]